MAKDLKEIRLCISIVALAVIILGIAQSFRGDELIRQIKIAQNLESYEHLPSGWRACVALIAWLIYMLICPALISIAIDGFRK